MIEIITHSILRVLFLLLFVLIAFRKPLTLLFRTLSRGKSPSSDEQFRAIVEREKQKMEMEKADIDKSDSEPNPPV